MKKIISVLVVLLLAAPALAAVNIDLVDINDCWVEIRYDASGESSLPRAFGLDITVDAGDINDVDTSGCEAFDIYMGTIVINNGDVCDVGTPVAPSSDPGALGGLDTNGITIEMGSLYEDGVESAPNNVGLLIKVKVTESCNMTVSENTTRGGVVLEDTTTASTNMPYGEACVCGE